MTQKRSEGSHCGGWEDAAEAAPAAKESRRRDFLLLSENRVNGLLMGRCVWYNKDLKEKGRQGDEKGQAQAAPFPKRKPGFLVSADGRKAENMKSRKEIYDKILQYKQYMILHEGAKDGSMDRYETEHHMQIPEDYRDWLRFSNGGEINVPGTVLYGIDFENSPSAPESTLEFANRKEIRKELFSVPDEYLIIGKLNYGDFLCMDLSGRHEIIQWDHENDEEFCRWDSFAEWLKENLEEIEEY